MAAKYRLPCHDDAFVLVDASQAGLTVTCPCGKEVQVPTWRELSRLERIELAPDRATARREAAAATSTWTAQKGLIFLGLVILAACGASAAFWYKTTPTEEPVHVNYEFIRQHAQSLTLIESMKEWEQLRKGMPEGELRVMNQFVATQEAHRRWTYISLSGCAVGVVLCLLGATTGRKSGGKKSGRPRSGQK